MCGPGAGSMSASSRKLGWRRKQICIASALVAWTSGVRLHVQRWQATATANSQIHSRFLVKELGLTFLWFLEFFGYAWCIFLNLFDHHLCFQCFSLRTGNVVLAMIPKKIDGSMKQALMVCYVTSIWISPRKPKLATNKVSMNYVVALRVLEMYPHEASKMWLADAVSTAWVLEPTAVAAILDVDHVLESENGLRFFFPLLPVTWWTRRKSWRKTGPKRATARKLQACTSHVPEKHGKKEVQRDRRLLIQMARQTIRKRNPTNRKNKKGKKNRRRWREFNIRWRERYQEVNEVFEIEKSKSTDRDSRLCCSQHLEEWHWQKSHWRLHEQTQSEGWRSFSWFSPFLQGELQLQAEPAKGLREGMEQDPNYGFWILQTAAF